MMMPPMTTTRAAAHSRLSARCFWSFSGTAIQPDSRMRRRSAHRRDVEIGILPDAAFRPALRHCLYSRVETHALRPMLVNVAEGRALPAAERMVSERHGDGNVNAHHADLDPGGELARRIAVTGEDGDAVAVLVLRGQRDGVVEVAGAGDLQHRPEDLLLVRLHLGLDP